ncbi:MAG: DMT family transporter [Jatrophihabitantaceae bacterium]
MIYPVGILAALLLGLGYVLQQRVAATAPLADLLKFQLLVDLMRRPLWWVGIGAMALGQLLSGFALQLASVTLVEPLLSTNLLFALAVAAMIARHRPTASEIGGAVLLSGALGVFIAVGRPRSGHVHGTDLTGVVTALVTLAALVIVCVVVGRRRGLVGESVWLASGAGLLFGLQDAATRAGLLEFDHHGLVSLFLHVWVYVMVVAAVLGILLAQSAFKAARLDCSLPPITALEPLVGIALGIGLLGDTVSFSIPGLAVESACLVAMVAGVALIGRSPNLATSCAEVRPPAPVG